MNKIKVFLCIIIILVINGCNKKNESNEIKDKRLQEVNSGIKNDTLFLGYTFGMTKDQFDKRTRELYKKGTLYLNDEKYYAYEMNLDKGVLGKAEAIYTPTFFENKLYKLTVYVKGKGNLASCTSPALIQIMLVTLYAQKYGYGFIKEKGALKNEDNYVLIQGNREIKIIVAIDDARVFYTDLPVEKEYEKSIEIESKKDVDGTKSNL